MAGTVQEFYGNDIVYRFDKRKRIVFGVVTESYEASSDVDDFDNLEKGQIRVWWFMSSRERVWKQSKVKLLNRTILPGDIVRRFVQGQDTQRGYCKSAKQSVTVQIVGTDKIIEKICSSRLKPVSKFMFDKTVCLDNKYGRIQNVESKVIMQAECGSSVELSKCSSTQASLDDFWLSKRNRWYSGPYYPGQEVVCIPQYLHNANWIHRSKTMKRRMQSRMRFTIQNVEIESVEIAWYAPFDSENGVVDKCTIKGPDLKKLKVLDYGEPHLLDLAERMFLKLSSSDKLVKKGDWLRKLTNLYKPDVHKVTSKHTLNRASRQYRRSSSITQPVNATPALQPSVSDSEEWWTDEGGVSDNGSTSSSTSAKKNKRKRHWPPRAKEIVPGNTLAVEVLCFESKITVVWQDGTIEEDIPSTQLYYSMSLDDHEFFPGEWVVSEGNQNGEEYGAVQSVNHLERTAKVKWFRVYPKPPSSSDPPTALPTQIPTYLHTSELSVYDLQKHQGYQFRPDSIVYPTAPTSTCQLGHVLDSYPEGYVHVRWMDGTETQAWPQDLVLLPEADYDVMSDSDDSMSIAPGSWETESVESVNGDNLQDETSLALMASKLDFIRNKIIYLKEVFKQFRTSDNFAHMRDLLIMYDNSSYLDKLLGTSFFSRRSRHFKMLLEQFRERAKSIGIVLSGRLFSSESQQSVSIKNAEKQNLEKVKNMESTLNAQISQSQSAESITAPDDLATSNENLCVELLSMLKARMDLAYAEIVSRIGGQEALMVMTKASEHTPAPTVPSTPTDNPQVTQNVLKEMEVEVHVEEIQDTALKPTPSTSGEGYCVLDEAPKSHHFFSTIIAPNNTQEYFRALKREVKLMEEGLPEGVWVRAYSNRMDLLSVMIRGPSKTPYEDGLFFFDIQLGADYPHSPPMVHYISFSSERLNPNLYVEGKVCVSLLGTWIGKGSEVWGPTSSLLQLIVSIQGLILVSEPYYNEAGYEKQVESQQGYENSRTYNELVILKLVQAMTVLIVYPPEVFKNEILTHFAQNGTKITERIEKWTSKTDPYCPDFPLLPVSKGFLLSLNSALTSLKEIFTNVIEEFSYKK